MYLCSVVYGTVLRSIMSCIRAVMSPGTPAATRHASCCGRLWLRPRTLLHPGKRKGGGRESLKASAEDTSGEGQRTETLRPFGVPGPHLSQQLGTAQGSPGQGTAGGGGGDSPGFFQQSRWMRAASRAQCLVACCCKLLAAGFGVPVSVLLSSSYCTSHSSSHCTSYCHTWPESMLWRTDCTALSA